MCRATGHNKLSCVEMSAQSRCSFVQLPHVTRTKNAFDLYGFETEIVYSTSQIFSVYWVSMYAFVFPCRACVKFSQQRLAIASSCLLFMYAGIHCIMACLAVGRGSATWPLHQILMYSFSVVSECLFIDEMFAWWTFWSRSTGIPMSLIWMGAGWHATVGLRSAF